MGKYFNKKNYLYGLYGIAAIDALVIGGSILGSLSGAALMGSMFAILGFLPPFILLQLTGMNATLVGLFNLVVTVFLVARTLPKSGSLPQTD